MCVDHILEYKVPKAVFTDKEDKTKIGYQKEAEEGGGSDIDKLYKPSGPDGKGWGEFRSLNQTDLELLDLHKAEVERQKLVKRVAEEDQR